MNWNKESRKTNHDEEVSIRPPELQQSNGLRKGLLAFKLDIETLAKGWLRAHRLKNKDTHPNHTLLGWVESILHCVEDTEYQKVVGAVGVNDERPESLVAL